MGGSVNQLVPSPPSADPQNFPRKLSETGLFESIRDLRPAPGLIPYTVNAPLWSDGGTKERYLALPGDSKIEYDAMLFPGDETTPGKGWKFPAGTVLVKTFFLDLEKGNPARRIRLETRLLHHKRRSAGRNSATNSGAATPTSGTTNRPTRRCSRTRMGSIGPSRFARPTPRGAPGSKPGTSPAAPNAWSATPCPPSSSSA